MEEKTKNIILGTIYSAILFMIFFTWFNRISGILLKAIYPPEKSDIGAFMMFPPVIPSIVAIVLTVILAILATYLILHFARIERMNEFLKPNKFKVSMGVAVILLIIVLYYLAELDRINYYVLNILMIRLVPFDLFFFMEILFPIIVYYIIICLIDKYIIEKNRVKEI